jgi:hypothetical protein
MLKYERKDIILFIGMLIHTLLLIYSYIKMYRIGMFKIALWYMIFFVIYVGITNKIISEYDRK